MPSYKTNKKIENLLLRIHPLHKVIISTILSLVTFFILQKGDLNWKVVVLIIWIVFASSYLLLSWMVFFACSREQMRSHAGKEDGSRVFVSVLILFSSFAGMLTVLLLIVGGSSPDTSKAVLVCIAIISMFLSWSMVHTTYCFHYAHLFYDANDDDTKENTGGLNFPNENEPDYLDFAYFSFVVGMTFQVSDVQVTSAIIRRQALLHGLLSFGLNTIVVALTFNLIAGLMK